MKPFQIAKRFGLSEAYIYSVMRYLEAKGVQFTKKGYRYDLTWKEVELIERELQRRGKTPMEVKS